LFLSGNQNRLCHDFLKLFADGKCPVVDMILANLIFKKAQEFFEILVLGGNGVDWCALDV